ncbi:hypothetical protein ACIOGZ_08285 [Kitasatospora sp. NPDC088160]|uniref:hypothetical protein n=1 Tax=Kitasatospora sp. NPDC088160 TaxID=3364072 RepID=UPI00380701DD
MNTNTLVHSPAILGELPEGTVIRDADGDTGTKAGDGFAVVGWRYPLAPEWFAMPATVVGPPPATVQLIADLSGPLTLPVLLAELRSIAADLNDLIKRQENELDELRDDYGDVLSGELADWDELKADHHEEGSAALGAVLLRLGELTSTRSGP